jgi:hypothetical protein
MTTKPTFLQAVEARHAGLLFSDPANLSVGEMRRLLAYARGAAPDATGKEAVAHLTIFRGLQGQRDARFLEFGHLPYGEYALCVRTAVLIPAAKLNELRRESIEGMDDMAGLPGILKGQAS